MHLAQQGIPLGDSERFAIVCQAMVKQVQHGVQCPGGESLLVWHGAALGVCQVKPTDGTTAHGEYAGAGSGRGPPGLVRKGEIGLSDGRGGQAHLDQQGDIGVTMWTTQESLL